MREGIINFEAEMKANKMRGIVYWIGCILICLEFFVGAAI
jgi:hypothetical protein